MKKQKTLFINHKMSLLLILSMLFFSEQIVAQDAINIIWDTEVGCLDYKDDRNLGGNTIDPSECVRVCELSEVTYSLTGNSSTWTSAVWEVGGGVMTASNLTSCTVEWGSAGTGLVLVTLTKIDGSIEELSVCIEKTPNPTANFSVTPFVGQTMVDVCLENLVYFSNTSITNGGSELESFYWDFGDGQISTEFSPTHQYAAAGSYFVNLTVTNACNCTSEYTVEVKVYEGGFQIECSSVVCEGQQTSYAIPQDVADSCAQANVNNAWHVINGTISSYPSNSEVIIDWDNPDGSGFGYVSYDASGCGLGCGSIVTIEVPIIETEGKIVGEMILCEGDQAKYSLPQWPSTDFNWSLQPNNTNAFITNALHANEVVFQAGGAGNVVLECTYFNTLVGCGGTATFIITVLPQAIIEGDFFVCAGETETYTLNNGTSGSWELSGPIPTVTGTGNSFTQLFTEPGVYILLFEDAAFCEPVEKAIKVRLQEEEPEEILGPFLACTEVPNTYSVVNNIPGTSIHWDVDNGEVEGDGIGNSVNIIFDANPTGPYKVYAWRENNTEPNCPSDSISIEINIPQVTVNFTGDTVVCASSYAEYTADYADGEDYIWTINPPEAGSVSDGNGTNEVEVLWNQGDYPATELILNVVKCGVANQFIYLVDVITSPPIEFVNPPTTACKGEVVSFNIQAIPNLTSGQITWDFGDGTTGNVYNNPSSGMSVNHIFSTNITTDTQYTVTVTATGINGCITPNVIQHVITIKPKPIAVLNPSGNIIVCSQTDTVNENLSLTLVGGTSGNTIRWYLNNQSNEITAAFNQTSYNATAYGNYFVVITNADGCQTTTKITKIIDQCPGVGQEPCQLSPEPTLTLTGSNDCGTISLSGTASGTPLSYSWTAQNPDFVSSTLNGTSASYTYDEPGLYTFFFRATYSNGENTCTRTTSHTVLIPYIPNLNFSIGCDNGVGYLVTLQDNSDIYPGIVLDEYEFFVNNVSQGTITSSTQTVSLAPGSHTFKIRIKDTAYPSCTSGNVSLNLPDLPDATIIGLDAICVGLPAAFVPANPQPGWSYFWLLDFGVTNLQQNVSRVYDGSSLSFEVILTVTNPLGCTDTQSHLINITQDDFVGSVSASATSACIGSGIQLFYNNENSENIPSNFIWKRNGIAVGTTSVPTFEVFQSGIYSVEVGNAFGCTKEFGEINLFFKTPNATITGPEAKCADSDFTLFTSSANNAIITWKQNGTILTANQNQSSLPQNLSVPGVYIYEVLLQIPDGNGGFCTDTDTHTITIHANPDVPVINVTNYDCDNYLFELTATANQPGTFTWSNGTNGDTTVVSQGGLYQVTFTNLSGCSKSATIEVPYDPSVHFWNVPVGCYEFCVEEALNGNNFINDIPIQFPFWQWDLNQSPIMQSTDASTPKVIISEFGPGTYSLTIDNGFCEKTSGDVNVSLLENCECDVTPRLIKLIIAYDMQGNCYYQMEYTINNPYNYPIAVTLSSSPAVGFFIPSTLQVPANSNNSYFVDYIPIQNFSGSIDVFFETITNKGNPCLKSLKVVLPGCTNNNRQITDNENETVRWSVSPNPAENYIICDYVLKASTEKEPMVHLALYNMFGKVVHTQSAEGAVNKQQIDLSILPSGLYVLILQTDDGQRMHQKIIKK